MNNYEQIKQNLVSAGNLMGLGVALSNLVNYGEAKGDSPKQVIKSMLSHMHLVLTHNK